MSSEDQKQREQILEFMTKGKVRLHDVDQEKDVRDFLAPLIEDQIVAVTSGMMELTPKGFPFLRNVCMALDLRLRREKPETKVFPKRFSG